MSGGTSVVRGGANKLPPLLLPVLIVILIEALASIQTWYPDLSWPVWVAVFLIGGNAFAYFLAGWLAARRKVQSALLSAFAMGVVLLILEAIARMVMVGFSQISVADGLFIEKLQQTVDLLSHFSKIQLIVLDVALQYMIFSPVYVGISILGGIAAKRRFSRIQV